MATIKIERLWVKSASWTITHVITGTVVAKGKGKVNASLTAQGEYRLAIEGFPTETITVY
jgi:hypothetical protein